MLVEKPETFKQEKNIASDSDDFHSIIVDDEEFEHMELTQVQHVNNIEV